MTRRIMFYWFMTALAIIILPVFFGWLSGQITDLLNGWLVR
jgi:hypothetical protein